MLVMCAVQRILPKLSELMSYGTFVINKIVQVRWYLYLCIEIECLECRKFSKQIMQVI